MDSKSYCSAMEALLRLAMRDTACFGDLTGDIDLPQASLRLAMRFKLRGMCALHEQCSTALRSFAA